MNLIKKVSIILLCIIVINFCFPICVRAEASWTGKLVEPIIDFVVWLGDGMMDIIHSVLFEQSSSVIRVDLNWTTGEIIGAILVGIAVAAAIIAIGACIVHFGPAIVAGLAKVAKALHIGKLTIGTLTAGTILKGAALGGLGVGIVVFNAFPDDKVALPLYSISPEEIFSNKIALFDVDFFNPTGDEKKEDIIDENGNVTGQRTTRVEKYKLANGQEIEIESTAGALQATISGWYIRLRDIAIVALLSILVYVGIRIILSSTSNDKAKYKQMIVDWVVALCLLFVMQYIMSFANIVIDKVTDLIVSSRDNLQYGCVVPYEDKILKSINKTMTEAGGTEYTKETLGVFKDDSGEFFTWKTNQMGYLRFGLQQTENNTANYMGYAVCFIALMFFTIFFIFTYLKRVLYLAFLTLIAPLVAMTYPIDKINDGKAQAFDMWIKEYIFNLLIQPLHLLLYTVLISSAIELARNNIIYSLVSIAFMIPAEKLMRKFFGFEKAQTPGMLGGAAGAAMVMAGMNKLMSRGPKGGKDNSRKGGDLNTDKENNSIKQHDDLDTDKYLADGSDKDNITPGDSISLKGSGVDQNQQYTEDKIAQVGRQWIDNRVAEAKNWWNTSPEALYARDAAHKISNSTLGQGTKKAAQVVGGKIKGGAKKVYNSRPIKGIRNSRTWQGTKEAGKLYAHGMANKITNKVKNGQLGKKAIRMVGGAALGATAGIIGLAAGVTSGDPSKAFQYAATGAAGGYTLGTGVTNVVSNALSVDGLKEKFNEGFYGEEEYKEMQIQKNIRMAKRDWEIQQFFEKKLGSKEEAKELMKSDTMEKCIRFGVEDPREIYAVHKLKNEKGISDEKGIAIALTNKEYVKDKNSNYLGAKEDEELNKTLLNRAKKNQRIKTDEEAEKIKKETRKLIDDFNEIKFKD